MSKWGAFFLILPVASVVLFAVAEHVGWSLPPNVSTIGVSIDHLYYVCLALTGVVFVFTQLALAFVVYYYAPKEGAEPEHRSTVSLIAWLLVPLAGFLALVAAFPMRLEAKLWTGGALGVGWILVARLLMFGARARREGRAVYSHGNTPLEVVWTIVPAAILAYLTFYQFPVWKELRYPREMPADVTPVRVIGRQFEWRIVYPGADGQLDTPDDLHVPNELHVVKGEETWIDLRAMDVIHSFFLPMHRVKQDAVPGLAIPVWFTCTTSTREYQENHPGEHFDIVCAELCGWGHYKMKGRLVVHDTRAELDAWLADQQRIQEARQ